MKGMLLTSFLFSVVAFNLYAYEVGDVVSCVKLDDLQVDRSVEFHCVESRDAGERYVLIEFISINCGPCVESLPSLDQLSKEFDGKLTVRAASIDRNLDLVNEFLARPENAQYITFPFAFDNNREAAKLYGIAYTPTMFILDENNKIVYEHIGLLFDVDMQAIRDIVGQ